MLIYKSSSIPFFCHADAVTLGTVYLMLETELLQWSTGSRDLLQCAVGLQRRRRMLFMLKAAVASYCVQF